ncbi:MAG: hypothetical protein DMD62_04890 [Gemmatimonadetes bacterium]|nr:MAG: hypothetical protein DMD62_04890 [Gemmatimonadota bacterium]
MTACPHPPAPLVPMPLAPGSRDAAVAWTRSTLPRAPMLIRFRWHYQDERVKYAGRGTIRIAPPDSLRFDFAGPLNLGSGAAVIIGDSVAWADPEKNFRALVPAVPMLWAAFTLVRPPAEAAAVFGAEVLDSLSHKRRVVWRFAQVEDTLDYVVTDSAGRESLLEAEWRRRGTLVARSRARRDSLQHPASARIDFPEGPARFELTVDVVDTAAVIPPDAWRSRH